MENILLTDKLIIKEVKMIQGKGFITAKDENDSTFYFTFDENNKMDFPLNVPLKFKCLVDVKSKIANIIECLLV